MHTAVEYDAPECMTYLLAHGVPVDWTDANGETALHTACRFGRAHLARILLEQGANGNLCALVSGYSPYHVAVRHHGYNEIQLMHEHGVNINLFDKVGRDGFYFIYFA
jgi:glycerophosphodiester phosphodiesterase